MSNAVTVGGLPVGGRQGITATLPSVDFTYRSVRLSSNFPRSDGKEEQA